MSGPLARDHRWVAADRFLPAAAILLLGGGLVPLLLFPQWDGLFFGFLTLVGVGWVGEQVFLLFSGSREENQFLKRNYWRAFALLMVATCAFYGLLMLVEWKGRPGFYFDDELMFDRRGWTIANSWSFGVRPPYEATYTNNFVWIVGTVYYLFGHHPLLVRLLNALCGLWLAAAVSGIARVVLPERPRASEYTFWLTALNPVTLIWVTSLVRDPQVATATAILLWSLIKVLEQGKLGLVPAALAGLGWLWYLRQLSASFCLVAILVGLGLREIGRQVTRARRRRGRVGNLVIVAAVAIAIVSCSSLWVPIFAQKYAQYGEFSGLGESDTFSNRFFSADGPTPLNIAVSAVRLLFIPNPLWFIEIGNFNAVVQSVVGMAWFVLMPFWISGWVALLKPRHYQLWVIHVFTLGLMLLAAGSLFTLYPEPLRVRVPALAFLMLFSAYGIDRYREARRGAPIRLLVANAYVAEWCLGIYYLLSKMDA